MSNKIEFNLAIEIFEKGFNAGRKYEMGYCELHHPAFKEKPINGYYDVTTSRNDTFLEFLKADLLEMLNEKGSNT